MDFVTEQISSEDAATIAHLIETHARPEMLAVELGTYTGRSALAMLPTIARSDGRLICVDWFRGNVGVEAEIGPSYRVNDIFSILVKNLAEAGHSGRVTIVHADTVQAARWCLARAEGPEFSERGVDVLFIDADHRYSAVKADLAAWLPKMKPGSLVFGHDFEAHLRDLDPGIVERYCEEDFVNGCHFGVIRAVCEAFPNVNRAGRMWWTLTGGTH